MADIHIAEARTNLEKKGFLDIDIDAWNSLQKSMLLLVYIISPKIGRRFIMSYAHSFSQGYTPLTVL